MASLPDASSVRHVLLPTLRRTVKGPNRWRIGRLLSVTNILIFFWIALLYWGERLVFHRSVSYCDWSKWESWPENANAHHVILVADPQLVDPHTYPGRPWPLSSLTTFYADLYIKRSFITLQKAFHPDTVIFLGDLFDGGREWSTPTSVSPDKRWRQYDQQFWLHEYGRFVDIFFRTWNKYSAGARPGQPGRKIITGLPGNHDLGFAAGVQLPVRERFITFFGDVNRVDVLANHTFVSVDTVSLSAWGSNKASDAIWKPTMEFLGNAPNIISRTEGRQIRIQNSLPSDRPSKHAVLAEKNLDKPVAGKTEPLREGLPRILLSHVPLYRPKGTPCGPLRERWPPSLADGDNDSSEPKMDERNAISISAGYQYQNVLTPEVSKLLTQKIGNISFAFSGDDHDYCEVVHRDFASAGHGIREITVKSISFAMGVRRPGVVLLSLWNPVNADGTKQTNTENMKSYDSTMQSKLCLLPDQLGIFLWYFKMICLTLASIIALSVRKMILPNRRSNETSKFHSVRPFFSRSAQSDADNSGLDRLKRVLSISDGNASESSSLAERGRFGLGSPGTRARSAGSISLHPPPAFVRGFFGPQTTSASTARRDGSAGDMRTRDDIFSDFGSGRVASSRTLRGAARAPASPLAALAFHVKWSLIRVGGVVMVWYFLLLWLG